jgi:chemotaxis family two-component system sensor histidine kinase/response regulator PixL
MIDSEIRDRAYQFFIEEAPELLDALEAGLLTIKQERNPAQIHELMRAAHSLKGGAATVGLDALNTIAHRLEDIFKAFYNEELEIDTELESLLLKAYDCLKEPLKQQIAEGNFDSESALAAAEPVFAQIEERLGDALVKANSYIPGSVELGVDIISSVFEVDVARVLESLATVLNSPQDYELAGEFRTQAEILAGFAEILDLPGFGEIVQTAIAALDARPQQVLPIMQLALADLQAARDVVLAGDRVRGGSPSAALVELAQNPSSTDLADELEVIATEAFCLEDLLCSDDIAIASAPNWQTNESDIEAISLEAGENSSAAIEAREKLELLEAELEAEVISQQASLVPVEFSPQLILENLKAVRQERQKTPNRSSAKRPVNNLKVKVDLSRLEKMNNFVGELVINRNSLALQQEQLQTNLRKLRQRLDQIQHSFGQFQELSDKMLIAPPHSPITSLDIQKTEGSDRLTSDFDLTNFDSLELDSYGQIHSLMQGMLEEMMQLEEAVDDIALFNRQSERTIKQQQQTLSELRDELMWARMLPLGEVLDRFPRGLRDLSIKYQKPVNLNLSGTEILVDKGILEKLSDPLLHLVRNAFAHGIEPPEIRLQQGKPERGQIEIRAYHRGDRTIIEIRDDGKGLDLEKIAQKAIEKGWLSVEQLAVTSKDQLLDFIFQPGFSTAEGVNELCGRGVGLDVVRSQLEELKGTITVNSLPRKGTTFTLRLPLTLTIAKFLVCPAGTTAVAFPSDSIQEIILPKNEQIKKLGTQRFLSWREQLLPIYQLVDLLDYNYPVLRNSQSEVLANMLSFTGKGNKSLLVLHGEQEDFALEIEGLGSERELVIKPFNGAIAPPSYIYGCPILADGTFIPAIDGAALLTHVLKQRKREKATTNNFAFLADRSLTATAPTLQAPTVLVVDDSAMMRRTLGITLEKVGYRVWQARDGWEAIELLQQSPQIQLIISDLEMPNLNGFEFLSQLRQDLELASIPVVMLTSRSNDKHRQLAMHLGATAYLTKPYIEQEFLAALNQIMGQCLPARLPAA